MRRTYFKHAWLSNHPLTPVCITWSPCVLSSSALSCHIRVCSSDSFSARSRSPASCSILARRPRMLCFSAWRSSDRFLRVAWFAWDKRERQRCWTGLTRTNVRVKGQTQHHQWPCVYCALFRGPFEWLCR